MSGDAPAVPDSVEVAADKAVIVDVADWAESWAHAHGLDDKTAFAIRLCVEEAVTNIVFYAYEEGQPPGRMSIIAARGDDSATIRISDDGRPFDVAKAIDPGKERDILSATIGGRGIRLIRKFSDGLAFERAGGVNQLTLTFLDRVSEPSK